MDYVSKLFLNFKVKVFIFVLICAQSDFKRAIRAFVQLEYRHN